MCDTVVCRCFFSGLLLSVNPVKIITDLQAVETEKYRSELAKVRAELEPWEKDLIEHKGKLDVACTETKLLNEKVRMTSFKCYCSVSSLKTVV